MSNKLFTFGTDSSYLEQLRKSQLQTKIYSDKVADADIGIRENLNVSRFDELLDEFKKQQMHFRLIEMQLRQENKELMNKITILEKQSNQKEIEIAKVQKEEKQDLDDLVIKQKKLEKQITQYEQELKKQLEINKKQETEISQLEMKLDQKTYNLQHYKQMIAKMEKTQSVEPKKEEDMKKQSVEQINIDNMMKNYEILQQKVAILEQLTAKSHEKESLLEMLFERHVGKRIQYDVY